MASLYGEYGVIVWAAAAILLASAIGAPAEPSPPAPLQLAQVVIREQIIIRGTSQQLPRGTRRGPHIAWVESKGPKCVPAKTIMGASLLGQNSVDLLLRNQSRIRARLEKSCPALDYYYGFYIKPNADGMICADRDTLRSRMGGECEIDQFRTLSPKALKGPKQADR
jgi:hypothetical protein